MGLGGGGLCCLWMFGGGGLWGGGWWVVLLDRYAALSIGVPWCENDLVPRT